MTLTRYLKHIQLVYDSDIEVGITGIFLFVCLFVVMFCFIFTIRKKSSLMIGTF